MESASSTAAVGAGAPAPAGTPPEAGLLENAEALWRELRGALHDQFQLAALETQRAGRSLADMLACAVAAALLLVSAWLGLMGAFVLLLIDVGVHAGLALLIAVALNVGGALVLLALIRHSSAQLAFPATRRSLEAARLQAGMPEQGPR